MKTGIAYTTKVSILLLCITFFFYNIIGNGYILLLISILPIVMKLLNNLKKKAACPYAWVFFIIAIMFSSAFSLASSKTNNFLFLSIIIFIIKIVLDNEQDWQGYFIKIVVLFAAINVVATLISEMFPEVMTSYARKVFSGEALDIYMSLFNNGAYPGVNGQTSINGYFISLFIAYMVSEIITNPHKVLNYILLGFSVIALFMTNKRSFLLGNIIAICILFLLNTASDKHKTRNIIIFVAVSGIIYLIFKFNPAANGILEKMKTLEESGDLSNGRVVYWEYTYKIFKEAPIFGVGAASLEEIYGVSTHNVYLQVLAEMGIYGFIVFIVFMLLSLKCSYKTYADMVEHNCANERVISGMALYMQVLFVVYCFFGNPLYGINFVIPYMMATSVSKSYSNLIQSTRGDELDENRDINIPQHS